MATRTIVALLALPFVLLPIVLGGVWTATLLLLIALGGAYELFDMLAIGGYHPARWLGLLWTGLLVLSGWQPHILPLSSVLVGGLICTLVYVLFVHDQPISTWTATTVGAVYLGVMVSQMMGLRLMENGLWWLLFGVLVTWANDTAAYFTGVTIGRHKLWPRLSPKKTWEGTVGGWLAAGLMGVLMLSVSPLHGPIWIGALLGSAAGVLALFGDLSVSMMKRQVGVKDSGRLVPGHGGILDRLDSILFVLPFIHQVVLHAPWVW